MDSGSSWCLTVRPDHIVHVPGRAVSVRSGIDEGDLAADTGKAAQSTQTSGSTANNHDVPDVAPRGIRMHVLILLEDGLLREESILQVDILQFREDEGPT